ncbi:MAG: stage II sporulation protein E [Bacillota bacterium]
MPERTGAARTAGPAVRRNAVRSVFSLEALPLAVLGFFIGRAAVLQTITPFGLAFFAAVLALGPRRAPAVAAAGAAGILSTGSIHGALEFLAAAAGLSLLLAAFDRQARARSPLTLGALAFTVTVVAGLTKSLILDPTPYRFLMVLFAGLLTFVLTLVYLTALPPLFSTARPLVLGPEQVIAGAITAATALAGLSGLGLGGMRVSTVAGGGLILIAAFLGGGGVGAAVGTVTGVVSSLCGAGGLSVVGLEALSGLLAGSFRDLGRAGSATGYFLGALLLSPLVEEALYLRGVILESAAAAALFLVLPLSLLTGLRGALERVTAVTAGESAADSSSTQEHLGRRLLGFSHVFGQLAATLREVSAAAPAGDQGQAASGPALASLAEAACRVCQSCRLFRSCWKGDLDRTLGALTGLLAVTVERGQLEARDLPTHIRRRCVHLGELVTTMNFLHEIAALNRHWRRKLDESRAVVYQQLGGLSTILRQLGEGLSLEADGGTRLTGDLRRHLHRAGFPVRSVAVLPVPDGKIELEITAESCECGEGCREIAGPLASSLVGRDLRVTAVRCGRLADEAECSFKLTAPRQLDFKIGVAQARKAPGGTVSGDSYMLRELPGNRLAAVLSDGPGAGPRAAAESQSTVRLLEELFKLGFDTEMTVKTVNSVLLLRSAQERYATLDLLTVDLDDGQARFVKIGAAPTYLRRGQEVSVISSPNLPLGVLPDLEITGHRHTLRAGDLVVLATDGLIAAGERAGPPGPPEDGWIVNLLRGAGDAGSQEIADALVEYAVGLANRLGAVVGGSPGTGSGRGLRDDVTVMALRFGPYEGD